MSETIVKAVIFSASRLPKLVARLAVVARWLWLLRNGER